MTNPRRSVRPILPRPARLAFSIPDAGSSGIIDASDLRAEPLVSSLAASLARSRPIPPPPLRARADAWPIVVLSTLLLAVVAFTGVAAISRFAPGVVHERAPVAGGHHLSMRTVSSPAPPQAVVQRPAPLEVDAGGASPASDAGTR